MKFFAWFCLLSASLAACGAAEFTIRTWDVDDGLPESGITDVIQSPDGYLWISTLNSGISRFDGVRFVNFEPPTSPQLASHGFRRLFADADGTLWLNGYGSYMASVRAGRFQWEYAGPAVINWLVWARSGRAVFATKEGQLLERTPLAGTKAAWKIIPVPGASGNERFFADAQTNFWYRTTKGEVCRMVGENREVISPDAAHSAVSALAGDRNGSIAVGTAQRLLVWNGTRFADLTPTNGEPNLPVRGLVSDEQGGWWVEANHRLRRCRDRQWIAEATDWQPEKRLWGRVRWEQADSQGNLWMAYADGGILHVSAAGRLSAITTEDGLPSNRVRTMSLDREGNVWASFERGGLVRVRPRLFQAIGSREGLSDIVATSVCEDSGGAIWIGTMGGSVSRWVSGVCTNFLLPRAGGACEMATVFPDPDGRIWIGTHGNGLLRYEAGQFHHVLTNQLWGNIRAIFVSHSGQVWVASQDGLFCLDHGDLRQWLVPKSEADYPAALAEGGGGNLWAAMNSGALVCWQGGSTTTFEPPNTALRCRFAAVLADPGGTVWIGTLGAGLLRFRDGQFAALTTRDGLPSDNITQVLDDGAGRLWLGSPAGVISLPKHAAEGWAPGAGATLNCRAYGRDDGLPTLGCAIASQPTAWRGHDGRLWFATARGVASLEQPGEETVQRPPLVVLEELRVDGEPARSDSSLPTAAASARNAGLQTRLDSKSNSSPPNEAASAPYFLASARQPGEPIKLSPGRHQLEFRYTGLSFNDPERMRFKYWLEGLDAAWMETSERIASYHLVPPGTYRFHVQAQSSDGAFSDAEALLTVIVPPYFWETRPFRAASLGAILLAVAGTVFGILQIRYRRQLRALEQRHALERERARIAQDIHDDLGASLTRIAMLSQSALGRAEPAPAPAAELSRIYQTARAMTAAMDEIVWAINPAHDTLESLAAYFAGFVQEYLTPAGLKFNLDLPLTLPPLAISSEVRHNLFLAFKEALHNVVKHAQATEVLVTLELRPGGFVLSVRDNGQGFVLSDLRPPPSARPARGNGLKNMRQRLAELGGSCEIESIPGRGTRVSFQVHLPA